MKFVKGFIVSCFAVFVVLLIVAGVVSAVSGPRTSAYDANVDQVWASETGSATSPTKIEKNSAKPKLTVSQENAIESAETYLEFSGFSKEGLIEQLSSKVAEGYSKADATYAVNHVEVDWNAEAVESAELYMDMFAYSHNGLVKQMTSKAGSGFTKAQAEYAAKKVGL